MPPIIRVDTNPHETPLYEHIDRLRLERSLAVTLERTRLDVGDVEIVASGQDGPTEVLWLERKTWPDWVASITDGRYRDQKKRALQAIDGDPKGRLVYVLETPQVERWNESTRNMKNVVPIAASIKTMLRDHVPVVRVHSSIDSAELALYLCKQLSEGNLNEDARQHAIDSRQSGVFKRKRSCDMQPDALFKGMLSAIPGMGQRKVGILYNEFQTIHQLTHACLHQPSRIAELKVGSKRVGESTTQALQRALLGPQGAPGQGSEP